MAELRIEELSRHFGDISAVDALSATLPEGSFTALLGPSGCGKSTLLRLIAGLERPDSGQLWLGDTLVAGPRSFVEPEARALGMVFQSYALWPHMSVAGNVGFGLNRLTRVEREARIREALAMVGLAEMAERKPHELSGGQRQRVALARSLAARPRILLLDEPLANLDAHLRQSMLAEFRRIHAATGCTMVLVTHDQNEAMAVASLVGIMQAGRLEQLGSPQELYDRPRTEMVARFIGNGRTLPVAVTARSGNRCEVAIGTHRMTLPGCAQPGPAWLCVHARDLAVSPQGLPARISALRFEDGFFVADVLLDDLPEAEHLSLRLDRRAETGERIGLSVRGGWVLPRRSTERLGAYQALPQVEGTA